MNALLKKSVSEGYPLWVSCERHELLIRCQTALRENGNHATRICYRSHDIGRIIAMCEELMAQKCSVNVDLFWSSDLDKWQYGWKVEYYERIRALRAFDRI